MLTPPKTPWSPIRCRSPFTYRTLQLLLISTVVASTFLLGTLYVCVDGPRQIYANKWFFSRFLNYTGLLTAELASSTAEKPIILLWTPFFHNSEWLPTLSSLNCPVQDCKITSDRRLLNSTWAVVFHLRDVVTADLPPFNGNQLWVLLNHEAPPHTPRHILEALQGMIHWTVSYRRDSDIVAPYGTIGRRTCEQTPISERRKEHKYLACWVVSNCDTPSKRETYVEELRHYIRVRIYGKCGRKLCSSKNVSGCYEAISKKCKFYLSFENSICKDYATEKIFEALKTDMVPVVLGGADYHKTLPNHSYIDAMDFNSPKDLADFLIDLSEDEERYDSYHAWKKDFEVQDASYRWACELCRKLHEPGDFNTTHWDLVDWWYGGSNCSTWSKRMEDF